MHRLPSHLHPKIPAVITQTEVLPPSHPDFYATFPVLLVDFYFQVKTAFKLITEQTLSERSCCPSGM